jgi:hypothetical protein
MSGCIYNNSCVKCDCRLQTARVGSLVYDCWMVMDHWDFWWLVLHLSHCAVETIPRPNVQTCFTKQQWSLSEQVMSIPLSVVKYQGLDHWTDCLKFNMGDFRWMLSGNSNPSQRRITIPDILHEVLHVPLSSSRADVSKYLPERKKVDKLETHILFSRHVFHKSYWSRDN